MNQERVIQEIYRSLRTNPWSDFSTVKCDHVTEAKEELALFIGLKTHGQGRRNRIAEVDILVCNELTKTVELIIEVDPNCAPKILMGNVMSVLLADNYTPSNSYSPYTIKDTLVIFLTLLARRQGSQKASQFEVIEGAMRQKLDLGELGAKDVILCHGATEEEAIYNCQRAIQTHFGGTTNLHESGPAAPVKVSKTGSPSIAGQLCPPE